MNIIITGAYGFLGTHLSEALKEYDPYRISSGVYDLRIWSHIDNLFKHTGKPDIIFHCAANVGGIEYNLKNPATIFYDNVIMNTELIRQAALHACGKFIFVSSVCAYPKNVPLSIKEEYLWQGEPEESNRGYGLAKRIALTQLQSYRVQCGMRFEYPILANMYGPGDNFSEEKSHVIASLIRKFVSGDKVKVWGNGKQTRDFLYVKDAVKALVKFVDIDCGQSMNIASGTETSIKELIDYLAIISGYDGISLGDIVFDTNRPIGEFRRLYDISKAKQCLDWQPQTDIEDGLKETWEWYVSIERNEI